MENEVITTTEQRSVLDIIATAANDPNLNPDKMAALIALQERVMQIESRISFNKNLALLQAEMPTITKHGKVDFTNSKGQRTKYAYERYEDLDAALRPLLSQYGFSYIFVQTEEKGNYKGTLLHKDGHSNEGYFSADIDTSGGKNSIQGEGSTRSYARRQIFKGLLNIVTIGEDDDAQSFSYITPVQIAQIEERIVSDDIDKERLLKQIGVDSLEHIPQGMFETVIRAINARAGKKALAEGIKE